MAPKRTATCPFCAHSFEPHRTEIMPPAEFILAYEVMWLKPFGSKRIDAYERLEGGEYLARRYKVKELIKNSRALDDLIIFQRDLTRIGKELCEGKEWREVKGC